MPHIHLEYSDNLQQLEVRPLLIALNKALVDGGYVNSALDIKSRAQCQSMYVIGVDEPNQAYVHVKLSLLTGRSIETQQQISATLLNVLQQSIAQQTLQVQLCVELVEMNKATYSKVVIKLA